MRGFGGLAAVMLLTTLAPESAADVGAGGALESVVQPVATIDRISAECEGGVLTITGGATTNTPGWSKLRLKQVSATKDTMTFQAVGSPPTGIVAQVQEHVHLASQVNADKGIAHVHVTAADDALDADVMPAC